MTSAPGKDIVERRHDEWSLHNLRWRFLLDSWEGGDAYRTATYGADSTYHLPVRNLIRHKHEYPLPRKDGQGWSYDPAFAGSDPYSTANLDDYTLRLARTPVPEFLAEVVSAHLSRIYAKEVGRESADAKLTGWWSDIDGCGTSVDDWVSMVVAPLLMVFGCLDIIADHPRAPEDAEIVTLADQQIHQLDRCVASVILPENMVDWKLDRWGEYTECLVCELTDSKGDACEKVYRHWTALDWTLYDKEGKVIDSAEHPFKRPPIKRIFDRKRPRCKNVGLPRYEGVAECQREYYNRDSELILSDTTQAHPLLQGPEDYITPDSEVPIGPSFLLPKKKNSNGASTDYEGFEYINPPKDGAESIRQNLGLLRDRVDRAAMLTKPAGANGTTGSTVSQSGTSKRIDQSGGNDLLAAIATTLQRAEREIAELVWLVLHGTAAMPDQLAGIKITYPKAFDLLTAQELADGITQFQAILAAAGACPETEESLIGRMYRLLIPGLDDEEYTEADTEIAAYLAKKGAMTAQQDAATHAQAVQAQTVAETPPVAEEYEAEVPIGEGVA